MQIKYVYQRKKCLYNTNTISLKKWSKINQKYHCENLKILLNNNSKQKKWDKYRTTFVLNNFRRDNGAQS